MKKPYDFKFNSRVDPQAQREELTVAEIAGKYQVYPNQVSQGSYSHRLTSILLT